MVDMTDLEPGKLLLDLAGTTIDEERLDEAELVLGFGQLRFEILNLVEELVDAETVCRHWKGERPGLSVLGNDKSSKSGGRKSLISGSAEGKEFMRDGPGER